MTSTSISCFARAAEVPLAYRISPTTLPRDERPMGRLSALHIGVRQRLLDVLVVGPGAFADSEGDA